LIEPSQDGNDSGSETHDGNSGDNITADALRVMKHAKDDDASGDCVMTLAAVDVEEILRDRRSRDKAARGALYPC
jgi:hypothetical protein